MSDEDTLTPPAGLRGELLLRRGGWFTDGAPEPVDTSPFPSQHEDWARTVLQDPGTTQTLRTAGLGALTDPGSATPLGMAALLAAVFSGVEGWDWSPAGPGTPFLTHTVMLLAGINAGGAHQIADPHEAWRRWAPRCVIRFAGDVRNRLAVTTDDDYAAAQGLAATLRDGGTPRQWLISSLLFPSRPDWVQQDVERIAEIPDAGWLLASAGDAGQLQRLAGLPPDEDGPSPAMLVEGVGPAALPTMLSWLDAEAANRATWEGFRYGGANLDHSDAKRRRLAEAIALIPTDDAFAALIARAGDAEVLAALRGAADRFPRRALRMVPATGPWPVSDLLRAHVARHPDAALDMLPELPAATAALVRAMCGPDAPEAHLHPSLVSPPWHTTRVATPPVVIPGLVAEVADEVHWAPGEQERAADSDHHLYRPGRVPRDPAWVLARVQAGEIGYGEDVELAALGPDDMVRPMLAQWDPPWGALEEWLPPLLARWGGLLAPTALRVVQRSSASSMPLLMPLVSVDIAAQMADWFTRAKARRAHARAWLLRHPAAASCALIPAALARPGPERLAAETALRLLDRPTVLAAAGSYSPEAAAAIASMLDTDPLTVLPDKIPPVDWADPETLPRISLRDGSGALPAASARHLATMLAMSKPGDAYPGVPIVKGLLDPGELAEFGWALFRRWQQAGSPAKQDWAMTALGHIGDDETVRRLAPKIQAWPGQNGHSKAVAGLEVLASIGTDVALMHLHGIAQRVKFKGLKERAGQKLAEVAESRDLTAEQLADRLVPDLGLSADGTLRLDRFVVGFDESLTPYVTDENGKRRKTLRDDRFTALKKDVRTIGRDQIPRLERAMIDGRRWSGADFRQFLVEHPLLGHLTRRLLWAIHDPDGSVRPFRVTEDRTFTGIDDTNLTVADDAMIGLPHPAATDLHGWGEVFADHKIIQPFPQLGREVFRPSEADWDAFDGVAVPAVRLLGLEARGWRRDEPGMSGIQQSIERPLRDRGRVAVSFVPGFRVGKAAESGTQKLSDLVVIHDRAHEPVSPTGLDPVTASEVMLDLRTLL